MTVCVLIGMPGSGKSTIGRELSRILGSEFIDTDRRIESKTGRTVSNIFIEDGESAFRELERSTVLEALNQSNAVVSLGGGAILNDDIKEALKNHRVVWLETPLSDAFHRVGLNKARPLLLQNPRATLIKLLEERTPIYKSLATLTVNTADKSVKEVALEVTGLLEKEVKS
jgi:shikimate kinase